MKRFIAIMLAAVMLLSLCACGGGESKAETKAEAKTEAKTESKSEIVEEGKKIQFEIEDIKFEIDEYGNIGDVKVRNLSNEDINDAQMNFQLLDGNGDSLISSGSGVESMLAGQAAWMHIYCGDREAARNAKGIRFVNIRYDIRNRDIRDLPLGGKLIYDFSESTEGEAETYALNDTVETNSVRFTLTGFSYRDNMECDLGNGFTKYGPGDGQIWMCAAFKLENISKEKLRITNIVGATADYNDGYKYSTYDFSGVIVRTSDFHGSSYNTGSYLLDIIPLNATEYILLIPCASVIKDDTESPLKLIFDLKDGDGTKSFTYQIQ